MLMYIISSELNKYLFSEMVWSDIAMLKNGSVNSFHKKMN